MDLWGQIDRHGNRRATFFEIWGTFAVGLMLAAMQ